MMRFMTGLVLALGLMACESKGSAPATPEAAPPAKTVEAPAEAAAPTAIKVPADFEAAADQEITAENYPAKLDELAAQIEAE